jgi:hypothetical protein
MESWQWHGSRNFRLAGRNATSISARRLSGLGKERFEICSRSCGPSGQTCSLRLRGCAEAWLERFLSERLRIDTRRAACEHEQQRSAASFPTLLSSLSAETGTCSPRKNTRLATGEIRARLCQNHIVNASLSHNDTTSGPEILSAGNPQHWPALHVEEDSPLSVSFKLSARGRELFSRCRTLELVWVCSDEHKRTRPQRLGKHLQLHLRILGTRKPWL